jgi:hypothetical protein
MRMFRPLLPGLLVAVLACGAHAETVYKCIAANGQVTWQQDVCPRNQKQQAIVLDDSAPAAPPVAAVPGPTKPAVSAEPAPPVPRAPIPRLFACVRATDGTSYTSSDGNPPPYQAPYGMLGAGSLPLAHSGMDRASAPELRRGKVSSTLIGGNYVWVQDRCHELGPAETCRALRDDAEENDRKLRNAFQSQRGPFEQREAALQRQMRGC